MAGTLNDMRLEALERAITAAQGVFTRPFSPVVEGGLTELVGADEQVDQNDYGGSVEVALGSGVSGEILNLTFYSKETGSGSVQTPAGTLFIFDADPSITSGDTAMSVAARESVISQVTVAAADWKSDANGASVSVFDKPVSFHGVDSLFFAWFHEDATSLNDATGDDEVLQFTFWYRRDS